MLLYKIEKTESWSLPIIVQLVENKPQAIAASEGEGKYDLTDKEDFVSRATQVNVEISCDHRFSVRVLLDLADTQAREENYFSHLAGFNSYTKFQVV